MLLISSTFREAEELTAALESLVGEEAVGYYPAWETLPHERLSPRSDTVGRRLAVLRRLAGNSDLPAPQIVVAPVRSVLQPQVKGLGELKPIRLAVGDGLRSRWTWPLRWSARRTTRVDLVERRGEFAVRGGIVDVFPPTEEHPVRIDFFGDTVEEIRYFSVADQRSSDFALDEITASPCRELLLTDEVRARAAALAEQHPELIEMLDKIAQGHPSTAWRHCRQPWSTAWSCWSICCLPTPMCWSATRSWSAGERSSWSRPARSSSMPRGPRLRVAARRRSIWAPRPTSRWPTYVRRHSGEGWRGGRCHPSAQGRWTTLRPTPRFSPIRTEDGEIIDLSASGHGAWRRVAHGRRPGRRDLSWRHRGSGQRHHQRVRDGWRVVVVAEGRGTGRAVRRGARSSTRAHPACLAGCGAARRPGDRRHRPARAMASWPTRSRLAVFTAADLSGQRSADKASRKMPARRKNQIDPLELTSGDAVVHSQHGVGRYVEMTQRTVAGSVREYLVIEYAPSRRGQPGDRLYVPMDALDQVTRYVGGESPTLDRLGGADWAKRKGRARKAVREIAAELIKLYAARQATRGHAFSPDTTWQRELEDAFAFVETPDQLAADRGGQARHGADRPDGSVDLWRRRLWQDRDRSTRRVQGRTGRQAGGDLGSDHLAGAAALRDLRRSLRRIPGQCRAAQPVPVRRRDQERRSRVSQTAGSTSSSALIGCSSDEITFKDLGLVVIDEEQRFGVEHKEQLKRLRTAVDVLAMSATPIPRTLEMAVTGIREMSTIMTPPEERHPVLTFAGPYDEAQVTAAIRRELLREGQVFYVHNRVQSIEKAARRIAELVPEARVVTAHGQMSEQRLEQVMIDFWERRADVLVCTTIVEAGLDISTANTLLVERSDVLGLSQLHQLRGRVGRGRERGYAYFLYPPDKPLTETAYDRISTIAAHSDLGSGMAIAMKDLEIRGAGNLLGGEQSGHIADVGFDLYIQLVGEAVAEYRGHERRAGARGPDRASGRRAPAHRLHRVGAAAAGDVQAAGRGSCRGRRQSGRGGAPRPLRHASARGAAT